jgi:hypothetical protein
VRLDPGDPEGYNNCAMFLAACPEAKFRDGKRAVDFAIFACKLTGWTSPYILDTLAAAYAEAGDFDAAAQWQTRAIDILRDEWRKNAYHTRLVLYQAKKAYHEPSPGRPATEGHP